MGTLTADITRLPEYCEHKLPTSCRLTSIPGCCACADERAHAPSYSTYIDGIGFVSRGNRWQRYCWFCKEFWQRRVDVSGLSSSQTKIPEVPDQSDFLRRWYEFHRGYREVVKEDGTVEKIAVLGEAFRDVEPGDLPRTVEELREGRDRSEAALQSATRPPPEETIPNGPSLDEQLESMFQEVMAEDEDTTAVAHARELQIPSTHTEPTNIHAQAMQPAGSRNREHQARRIAALRRELHRMRNGIERVISGLRDLGESVPDSAGATANLANLDRRLGEISGVPSQEEAERAISSMNALASNVNISERDRTLANMQARVEEARQHLTESRRSREQATRELELADREYRTSERSLQQLQREQRTAENYMRVFGTREDIDRAGAEYESPIGGMFARAYERFQVAEEVRREERTLRRVIEDEHASGGEVARLQELDAARPDIWSVRQPGYPGHGMRDQDVTEEEPGTHDTPEATRRRRSSNILSETEGTENRIEPDPSAVAPNREEDALEEYYSLLRQQDWTQSSAAPGDDSSNFPQSMLNRAVSMREQDSASRNNVLRSMATAYRQSINEGHVPGEPGRSSQNMSEAWRSAVTENNLYSQPQAIQDSAKRFLDEERFRQLAAVSAEVEQAMVDRFTRGICSQADRTLLDQLYLHSLSAFSPVLDTEATQNDIRFMMSRFEASEHFREQVAASQDPSIRTSLEAVGDLTTLLTDIRNNEADVRAQSLFFAVSKNEELTWLAGLPTERARSWRRDGRTFGIDASFVAARNMLLRQANIEAMAEAVQMSARVRRESGLQMQQQMDILSRLQQGERNPEDREVLLAMLTNAGTRVMANLVLGQTNGGQFRGGLANGTIENLVMRNAVQSLDPDQMRTRLAGFSAWQADDESESEEEEAEEDESKGLDARDTGRPEAKTDEEMNVRLECRICYTQVAEVACLPCGHLVMCRWCSDQHSPTLAHDRTRPRRSAACPVCRKGIRQKLRVFRA